MTDACEIPRWQILKTKLVNLDPKPFQNLLRQTPSAILLDVRTPEEIDDFALDNAYPLNYLGADFLDVLEDWDRNATYFIYCRTGRRSVRAGILMHNWGFKNLINLEGGLVAWQEVFNS